MQPTRLPPAAAQTGQAAGRRRIGISPLWLLLAALLCVHGVLAAL